MNKKLKLTFAITTFSFVSIASFAQTSEYEVLKKAEQLYKAGNFKACIRQLGALPLQSRKAGAMAFYILGRCYFELGEYEKALSPLGISLKKDGKLIGNYYVRAVCLYELGRYEEAARDYESILKLDKHIKDRPTQIINYTTALVAGGDVEKAIRYLRENHNDDAKLLDALGVYLAIYANDFSAAIRYWEKALSVDPQRKETLFNMSIHYLKAGDGDQALRYIDKLIEYHPHYGKGYYLKGTLLEATGNKEEALLYYQRAKEEGYEGDTRG